MFRRSKGKVQIWAIILIPVAVVVVLTFLPLISIGSVSAIINTLESRGYVVLAAGEYNAITSSLSDIEDKVDAVQTTADGIQNELSHRSYIFPDLSSNIDLTCTFTSGAIDSFGTWAEITDSGATTLTSIVATSNVHVSALKIRTTSDADVLYVIEVGYGPDTDNVTIWDVHEFGSGTKQIGPDEQVRFRPPPIPQGQKAYYRMKTENNANATVTIELRYHFG